MQVGCGATNFFDDTRSHLHSALDVSARGVDASLQITEARYSPTQCIPHASEIVALLYPRCARCVSDTIFGCVDGSRCFASITTAWAPTVASSEMLEDARYMEGVFADQNRGSGRGRVGCVFKSVEAYGAQIFVLVVHKCVLLRLNVHPARASCICFLYCTQQKKTNFKCTFVHACISDPNMFRVCSWCCCGGTRKSHSGKLPPQIHRSDVNASKNERNDNSTKTAVEGADVQSSNMNGASTFNEIVLNQAGAGGGAPGVVVNLHPLSPMPRERSVCANAGSSSREFDTLLRTMRQILELQHVHIQQTSRLISSIHAFSSATTTSGTDERRSAHKHASHSPRATPFSDREQRSQHKRHNSSTYRNSSVERIPPLQLSPRSLSTPSHQYNNSSSRYRGGSLSSLSPIQSPIIGRSIERQRQSISE